jgi:ketosteroid isomerase-like protein
MGKLAFTNLAIRVLDSNYAIATGNFHLDRTTNAGGNADGIFSLIFKREPQGWKIILDHTSRTN